MIVLGYRHIPSPVFYFVKTKQDIINTPNNSIVYIDTKVLDIKLFDYCNLNNIPYATIISSIKDLVIVSYYNAKYIIVDSKLINEAQQYANNYLIDSKIILVIDSEEQIEFCAKKSIDGVIFRDFIS